MKDEAEIMAYEQGQEDGYSKGWAAGNEHEDALDAEIAKLKAERDAAFVRGLERAKEIIAERRKTEGYVFAEHSGILDISDAIQAEIDKAKGCEMTLRNIASVVAGFLLIAGPWIGLLSYKYGRPTFSTIGPIQHAIVGPPDMSRDHPDHLHFYKPEPGRITTSEDPTDLPYNYWSPFESVAYARHQASLVYHNAGTILHYLRGFDWLGLGLISAICGIVGIRKGDP